MNKLHIISILILIFFSCEKEFHVQSTDCDYCYDYEPEYSELIISLSINDENPQVPVSVFEGDIEQDIFISIDTVDSTVFYAPVVVNKEYSVMAEYKSGDKNIIVIDKDKISTRYVTDECDPDCWTVKGGYIDVRLKYDDI